MKILLFSHKSDIDGMGEVILCNLAFKNDTFEYILCTNVADLAVKMKDEYDKGNLYKFDRIYITDLSPIKEVAEIVFKDEKLNNKVFVFDHHETAYANGIQEYPNCTIRIKDEKGISCATQIFYEYLVSRGFIKQTRILDDFVELVRREDTYEWKKLGDTKAHDLAVLYNAIGYKKYIKQITNKLENYIINNDDSTFEFDEDELENIIEKKDMTIAKVKSYLDGMKIRNIDDIRCGICFIAYEYRNEVADYIINNNVENIDVVMMIAFDNNQISLRSIKDNDYSRKIAEKYGGGGHDKAAAIHITEDIKAKIIDDVIL